jgi:heat shock protein HslJ
LLAQAGDAQAVSEHRAQRNLRVRNGWARLDHGVIVLSVAVSSKTVGGLLFGLLVACSTEKEGLELSGREFISESLAGRELVPGTEIRLRFRETELSATAGCNGMSGDYDFDADVLVVSRLGMTEIGCEPSLHAQDEWLAGFLQSSPKAELAEPRLTLTSPAATLTLLDREIKSPDRALVGTHWVGNGVGDGNGVSFGDGWDAATIAFGADGTVETFSGCQRGSGMFTALETTIDFAELTYDGAPCTNPNLERLSEPFLFALDGSDVTFAIEERSLSIERGGTRLYFAAAE